jgi:amidase
MIKDHNEEKGQPNSFGSEALRDNVGAQDAPYVKAIAEAGLISICRSACPNWD